MVDGLLVAVCRVHQLLPDRGNGVTAIDKRPVGGAVRASRFGLFGDVQAERRHHGGEDQAVSAYAEEDALHFSHELGRDVPPGLFGENLRTSGIDVTDAVIGERWRVGRQALAPKDAEVLLAAHADGAIVLRDKLRGHVDRALRRAPA